MTLTDNPNSFKLGILGGGQLGKMLLQVTNKWNITTYVLDPANDCAARNTCTHFVKGDFTDKQTVLDFGKLVDVLTIEIENVNTEALFELAKQGKTILPQPEVINTIQDKGLQKEFYLKNKLPSPSFILVNNKKEITEAYHQKKIKLPFVQKLRKGGYDGRGVYIVNSEKSFDNLMDAPSVIEECVEIKKEISVIVGRDMFGNTQAYAPTEMLVNETANLLDLLQSPASLGESKTKEAMVLAEKTINAFKLTGLLAVEMFLDKNDTILINESAPRTHNSGHQTIEANITSQFEQQLRAVMGLPLGSTKIKQASVMINLLGEEGYIGKPVYKGFSEALKTEGVYIHIYGKSETKPFRKMGHVTITDDDVNKAIEKAKHIKNILKVIS